MVEIPKVVAEIGCNHRGEMDVAEEMISTLDRTCRGSCHTASLEPGGMRRLVRDVRNVAHAVKPKEAELLPVDVETRRKLKWEPVTSGTVA